MTSKGEKTDDFLKKPSRIFHSQLLLLLLPFLLLLLPSFFSQLPPCIQIPHSFHLFCVLFLVFGLVLFFSMTTSRPLLPKPPPGGTAAIEGESLFYRGGNLNHGVAIAPSPSTDKALRK